MKKEEESIVPVGDADSKIETLRNPGDLQELLQQPYVKIAEFLTGLLTSGRTDAILVAGRLAQAAIKGNAYEQVHREVKAFQEKGRIKEDYAKTKYGFQSLADLLSFIDSEAPDEERLHAAKAMFFSINSSSATEGDQFVNYELLKLAKTMSGSELLLLRVSFKLSEKAVFMYPTSVFELRSWTNAVSQMMGHNLSALIYRDEKQLMEKGLMKPRNWGSDGNEEDRRMARLTDLGYQMCVNIRDYEGARREVSL